MQDLSFRNEVRRKLVHLSSLWMPLVMVCFAGQRWLLAGFFGVLTAGSVLLEHAYALNLRGVRALYDFFFGQMLRREPAPTNWVISGGPPVLAASCMALILFPPRLAAASMAVMLVGDTAAALIGKRFGRIRFANGKSLEGTLAFWAAGSVAFALFFAQPGIVWWKIAVISAVATAAGAAAELFQNRIRIDDNFAIPVCSGATAALLLWLWGNALT